MPEEEFQVYNLFISQLDESTYEFDKLIGKLKSVDNFTYKNFSIPGKTSRNELKEQMENVDAVVILSGLYSADNILIQREIEVAIGLKKPIIMVRPYGLENVPEKIEKTANEVIGWNAGCIVDTIVESLSDDDELD